MRPAETGVVVLLLLFVLSMSQAVQLQPAQPVSVEGIITNSGSGEPIPNVVVTLNPRAAAPMTGQRATATSDKDGRFSMPAVVPSRYTVTLQRPGFTIPRRLGLILELEIPAGRSVKDLKLALVPTSAVTGRVVDENGEPKSAALVQLMEVVYRDGRRMLGPARGPGGTTDERGEYRVFNVEPGEYYIRTLPGSNGPTFATSYYPGVSHPADATKIVVPLGSDLSAIDIPLVRGDLHTVRFKVQSATRLPDNTPIYFFLRPQDRGNLSTTAFNTPFDAVGDDTYVSPRLPPGAYEIQISYGTAGAALGVSRLNVNISDKDLDAGTIVIPPGRSISARVVNMEGLPPAIKIDQVVVRMTPIGSPPLFASGRLGQDGTARISREAPEPFRYQLHEGSYRVDISGVPPEFYISSAKFDGIEVLDHGLLIDGEPKGPLELSIAPGAAVVNGTVRDEKNQLVGNSRVVLVPAPSRRGSRTIFPTGVTDSSGTFSIFTVPPGEYGVLAFDYAGSSAADRFYEDPEFLKDFERRAEKVTVERSSMKTVNARIFPISRN